MSGASPIEPRESRRNEPGPVYLPPTSLEEALVEDLRYARQRYRGINEQVGAICQVEPKTVYSWGYRPHEWKTQEVLAVVMTTGGRHALAYLSMIASQSPVVAISDHRDLVGKFAGIVAEAAALSVQAAEDVSHRDDTPLVVDRREQRRLLSMTESLQAAVMEARAEVEHLEAE